MKGLNIKLEINQKIEVIDDELTYKSIVQDITQDAVYVSYPSNQGRYYFTHAGNAIEFYVTTDKEVIKCKSIVLGKKKEGNVDLMILSFPEVKERVQRREYFRLPITMQIKYYPLPKDRSYASLRDVPSGYFSKMLSSLTMDISGGGIKILAHEPHNIGEFIIVSLNIPQEINLLCSVVRVEETDEGRKYKLALKYESIDEKIRDRIIQFIFSKLREQNKLLR